MKIAGCGRGKVLTPEEFRKIKQHIHFKYQVFFDIMWNTGARVSEVCKLRFVDVVNGTLVIRKGNTKGKSETREIPIPPDLIDKINKLPKENGFMFAGMGGNNHITRYTIDKVLRNACRECGLEGVSTHSFRRTTITQLSRNSVSLRVIQKISGHRNLNVLQNYVDVDDNEIASALQTRWVI
jgi:integrase/recombinase XerD